MTLKYPSIKISNGHRTSPSGRTLWCGPFVVALLTGLEYDEAYAKTLADIRRAVMKQRRELAKRGYPVKRGDLPTSIKGTFEHQIARICGKLGVTMKLNYTGQMKARPTMLTFVREHTVKDRVYVVVAGHHWMTVENGILYHSWHEPKPLEDARKFKLAKVECWAEVRPIANRSQAAIAS